MAVLNLKTKAIKFFADDERALSKALSLTQDMEQHCPEVKGAAVTATDALKKLLAHVAKSRAPAEKEVERPSK